MNSEAHPLNERAYSQAQLAMRRMLDSAERGDVVARFALIEAAAAPALRVSLQRIATAADKCAPSTEDIKIDGRPYSLDQRELRFAADSASEALSQAAGRAVVAFLDASAA